MKTSTPSPLAVQRVAIYARVSSEQQPSKRRSPARLQLSMIAFPRRIPLGAGIDIPG
jgi:hypothetical protein